MCDKKATANGDSAPIAGRTLACPRCGSPIWDGTTLPPKALVVRCGQCNAKLLLRTKRPPSKSESSDKHRKAVEASAKEHGRAVRNGVALLFDIYGAKGFLAAHEAAYDTSTDHDALHKWWDLHLDRLGYVRGHLERRIRELYDALHEGDLECRRLTEVERREVLLLVYAALVLGKSGRAYTDLQLLAGAMMAHSASVDFCVVRERSLTSAIPLVMHYLQGARGMPVIQLVGTDVAARDNLSEAASIYEMLGVDAAIMDSNHTDQQKAQLFRNDRGGILYVSIATLFGAYLADGKRHTVFRFAGGNVLPFRVNIDEDVQVGTIVRETKVVRKARKAGSDGAVAESCDRCGAPFPPLLMELGAVVTGSGWGVCETCRTLFCPECATWEGAVIMCARCPNCRAMCCAPRSEHWRCAGT